MIVQLCSTVYTSLPNTSLRDFCEDKYSHSSSRYNIILYSTFMVGVRSVTMQRICYYTEYVYSSNAHACQGVSPSSDVCMAVCRVWCTCTYAHVFSSAFPLLIAGAPALR